MSSIVIASADDIESPTTNATPEQLDRRARRALEKQQYREATKAGPGPNTAVTYGVFPKLLAHGLTATIGPRIADIHGGMLEVYIDLQALTGVLVAKGILTQEDIDVMRTTVRDNMQKAANEARAKQNEAAQAEYDAGKKEADISEKSPAFQEATKNANGAAVQRLDEGAPAPSKLISL